MLLNGNWEMSKIKDISTTIQYGYTGSAISKGKYKMLRITDIQDDTVNWKTVPFVEIDDIKAKNYLLENNDIVFARTGATVGKSFLIKDLKDKTVFASYLIRIKLKKEFDVQYVKYFFESSFYWQQIQDKAIGTGQPNVNGTLLGELLIPLPPLPVQKSIVAQIECLFAEIDRIETARQRLLQAVKLARQKTLQLAMNGELVKCDEWHNFELKDTFDSIASKPYQILQSEILGNGKIPVISQSASYIEGYSINAERTLKIKSPIIIFGDHTRNVKFIDFDFIVGADGVKILVPKSAIFPKFLYYSVLYASDNIENRGYSRHFQYLSKFIIPIPHKDNKPDIGIQREIVKKIEDLFAQLDMIEKTISK